MEELRRLLPGGAARVRQALPFGLAAIDSHLPEGGLACGALHEIVPAAAGAVPQGNLPAALGFIGALLARLPRTHPLVFVIPASGLRHDGPPAALYGHGLRALGLDPAGLILVETASRNDTLWAMEEALRSQAPAAVVGLIDKLDLRVSQRLQFTAVEAGLPLLLLRPAALLEASAAATRWRVAPAPAARDCFGLIVRPRWRLALERCRNGRTGEWTVEYDHVAHRFSLAAALADHARARGPSKTNAQPAAVHRA
jgi:protein ImuA